MADVAVLSPSQAETCAGEVFAAYDAVFGDAPDEATWRASPYDRHRARRGFRLAVAREDGRLVGFAWGYVGEPGQYWTDRVLAALPPEVCEEWVGGHFEFVELAVLPEARGGGVGQRLHDALLFQAPADRALLGTDDADTPATRLYARSGWRRLGLLEPGVQVMGLRLPR